MNKNEFEIKKLGIEAERFGTVVNLIQHAFTLTAVVSGIYLVMNGLSQMLLAKPASLEAMAGLVEKLRVDSLISYIFLAGTSLGWVYERKGKKRAIKRLKDCRDEREREDPYRPSSNLDENGHTPQ